MSSDFFHSCCSEFQSIQDLICESLIQQGEVPFHEDKWNYHKGDGGGRTRVWEEGKLLEKAGVNFSGIQGGQLPPSALKAMPESAKDQPFSAAGVSLVLHPWNPFVPTIHMNIRYFECGPLWWFGGGVDLTPTYTTIEDVQNFHRPLKDLCKTHNRDYEKFKRNCDEYFYLPHRKETRGVGGLFFDHLKEDKDKDREFTMALGTLFPSLYEPFLKKYQNEPYSNEQRDFQLLRRSRYVEFNLLFDRGTHFGIQSDGRTESILMSMPATAKWKYNHKLSLRCSFR